MQIDLVVDTNTSSIESQISPVNIVSFKQYLENLQPTKETLVFISKAVSDPVIDIIESSSVQNYITVTSHRYTGVDVYIFTQIWNGYIIQVSETYMAFPRIPSNHDLKTLGIMKYENIKSQVLQMNEGLRYKMENILCITGDEIMRYTFATFMKSYCESEYFTTMQYFQYISYGNENDRKKTLTLLEACGYTMINDEEFLTPFHLAWDLYYVELAKRRKIGNMLKRKRIQI